MFVHRCQLLKYLNCDSVANERNYVLKSSVHNMEMGIMARPFAPSVNIIVK